LWLKIVRFFLFVERISAFRTLYLAEIFASVFGSVLGFWVFGTVGLAARGSLLLLLLLLFGSKGAIWV
jgi:hypothetical protein